MNCANSSAFVSGVCLGVLLAADNLPHASVFALLIAGIILASFGRLW